MFKMNRPQFIVNIVADHFRGLFIMEFSKHSSDTSALTTIRGALILELSRVFGNICS
jgi:hypothetical protein